MRFGAASISAIFTIALAACGDHSAGDAADASPALTEGSLPTPAWLDVDENGRTVTIDLTAGLTATNQLWNFNGFAGGEATLVVPEDFTVTINFDSLDPANSHSVAVLPVSDSFPPTFRDPEPVFRGAMSADATSITEAQSADDPTQSFSFRASRAGRYALVCLVPAHAFTGMWIGFEVSASGASGLRN